MLLGIDAVVVGFWIVAELSVFPGHRPSVGRNGTVVRTPTFVGMEGVWCAYSLSKKKKNFVALCEAVSV